GEPRPEDTTQGASKWDIREQVWDYLEASGLAAFPRPVHRRIPNFEAGELEKGKVMQTWSMQ
uniref:Uncharacterized protein n=1 Tax=Dromaius novaehollandiae TaxID=8790 RepID=A0A8C4K095_DRONO